MTEQYPNVITGRRENYSPLADDGAHRKRIQPTVQAYDGGMYEAFGFRIGDRFAAVKVFQDYSMEQLADALHELAEAIQLLPEVPVEDWQRTAR